MAKTLPEDLRGRVTAAVEAGLSRRAVAERFGVAVASAIRWISAFRTTGATAAKPKRGDLRLHRIEAFRDVIPQAIEARKDVTLVDLAAMLDREHGALFAPSTVRRFLVRHRIALKKIRRTPAGKTARTWHGAGRPGLTANPSG